MELQGQEVLSLQDTLGCSICESIRWRHCETKALRANFFRRNYKNQKYFLIHKWWVSQETHLVILRLLSEISTRRSTSKSGTGKDYLLRLRSSVMSTFKCLIKDSLLWCDVMSTTLNNPKDQDGHKKGTLSNQPWLTCVTATALLGSWVLQPIKDMTSLGTNFEMHANWQGYAEESAAKNFVARKVRTIALNEVQGTQWDANECQERLGNCSEAVVWQATINLNSWVSKSLEDSLPKLYCVDLA